MVRESLNPALFITGMVLTMYDPRTNLSDQVVAEVRNHFPQQTFDTVIPRSVRLSEAPSYGRTILEYAPSSSGARAYQALAQELLAREALEGDPLEGAAPTPAALEAINAGEE